MLIMKYSSFSKSFIGKTPISARPLLCSYSLWMTQYKSNLLWYFSALNTKKQFSQQRKMWRLNRVNFCVKWRLWVILKWNELYMNCTM